jgi:hypothetical protein
MSSRGWCSGLSAVVVLSLWWLAEFRSGHGSLAVLRSPPGLAVLRLSVVRVVVRLSVVGVVPRLSVVGVLVPVV